MISISVLEVLVLCHLIVSVHFYALLNCGLCCLNPFLSFRTQSHHIKMYWSPGFLLTISKLVALRLDNTSMS